MLLDDNTIKMLICIAKMKKPITISGCNNFGQEFKVKGLISLDDRNSPAVGSNGIYLDFGRPQNDQYHSEYVSGYITDIVDEHQNPTSIGRYYIGFIIKDITYKKDVVYHNDDYVAYHDNAIKYKQLADKELAFKHLDIVEYDNVSNHLLSMVGKPINIDGQKCIMNSFRGISSYGQTIINTMSYTTNGVEMIGINSVLKGVNSGGNEYDIAKNNKKDTLPIINRRLQRLNPDSDSAKSK